ncbi:MAG: aminotransferase class V-fold PLP-dependent enzyme [Syntrophomonadaceae bacterium]|jgi:cysteine desulfurase/selenocysteine lyase
MSQQLGFPYRSFRRQVIGVEHRVPTRRSRQSAYVYFDNAASTPALQPIVDQMLDYLGWYSGVHRGTGYKSWFSSRLYDESHRIIGSFVGADLDRDTVILTKNTTEAINKLAHRFPWNADDLVITTEMEHHSNDLPWRLRTRVEYAPVDETGLLQIDVLEKILKANYPHTRLLAVCGASNVTGHLNDIHYLAALAHEYGALILVDGAQLVPHVPVNMKAHHDPEHIDFLAFSGHKIYAPFGCGALIGPRQFFQQGPPEYAGGGTVSLVTREKIVWAELPDKEEAGSPNVVGAMALADTLHYLKKIGLQRLATYEEYLTQYAWEALATVPGLILYGSHPRVGVISFNLTAIPHSQLGSVLCHEGGFGVRTGCFCAQTYVRKLLGINPHLSPQHWLNVSPAHWPGMVRISLAAYNTCEEIDRLVALLRQISRNPGYYKRLYPYFPDQQEYLPFPNYRFSANG